jgi:hypothetical protein
MTRSRFRLRRTAPAFALLLSGCAGVGSYMHDTLSPYGNPNAAASQTLNMQRARGKDVAVAPITPMPGDVWPGPLQPVPSLSDIQKNMNVPLSEAYNRRRGMSSGVPLAADQGSLLAPPGVTSQITNPGFVPPPQLPGPSSSFPIGQTLVAPTGPVGIVTSGSNGRYQTVAPINGQGGGILTSNGNGTATLQGPDGQITTVPAPGH